jgi:hypothetical protein
VGGCSRRKKSKGLFHDIPFLCGYKAEIFFVFFVLFFFIKPSWGAKPGFDFGPAVQQASAQSTELRCSLLSYAASC